MVPRASRPAVTPGFSQPSRLPRDPSPTPPATTLSSRAHAAPVHAVFAGAGLAAVLALIPLLAAVRVPETLDVLDESAAVATASADIGDPTLAAPSAEEAPPRNASSGEIDAARASGLDALGLLAANHPADAGVLRALMVAHAERSALGDAATDAHRLVVASPEAASDGEVHRVLTLAANAPLEVAGQAFTVITSDLGAHGPDLLYELVTAAGSSALARDHASRLLAEPAGRLHATPALAVADELRRATPCGRKPLLARAHDDGDARSLMHLKPLLQTSGCGFLRRSDCYSCLGSRTELRAAISAIEARDARDAGAPTTPPPSK